MVDIKVTAEDIDQVHKWRDATRSIPALVREDIVKGNYKPASPKMDFKALQEYPLAIQYSMGYKDRRHSISYDMARHVVQNLSLLSSIINTLTAQIASFAQPFRLSGSLGFVIKHKNPAKVTTKGEREMIRSMEAFMYNCGAEKPNPHNKGEYVRDDFETLIRKLVRDSLTFDQVCVEIVNDRRGLPYEFKAVDAATIRMAAKPPATYDDDPWGYADRGFVHSSNPYARIHAAQNDPANKNPSYVQVINGQLFRAFTREEMAFGVRNPRTDIYVQGYGHSEIEQLITIITAHLYAEEYNRRFFMNACVAGHTLVHTEEGMTEIKDLVGKTFKSWNGEEFVDSTAVSSGHRTAVVTTLNGFNEITTSPDHKFLTFNSEGDCVMVPIEDLKVGDYVAQSKTAEEFAPLAPVQVEVGTHNKCPVRTVGDLDAEFYEFIGWLVGDGFISNNHASLNSKFDCRSYTVQCCFGPKDADARARFREMLTRRDINFNECETDYSKSDAHWGTSVVHTLQIRNKGLFEFLRDVVGMSESKSHEKTVPTRVFKESKENRAAFLRGLFSADGFIKNKFQAHFCSSSKELVEGVQQVLWTLGIRSTYSHTLNNSSGRQCHYVRVSDHLEFAEQVGFILDYKRQVFPKGYTRERESIPRPLQMALYEKLLGKPCTLKYFSYSKLKAAEKRHNANLEALKYSWTKITKIVDTGIEIPTYDVVQAHHKHRWSTGPCIVSNSMPKGILAIKGDSMDTDMFEGFKREWEANVAGTANAFKTPMIQSEAGIDWINMNPSNRDMEYGQWVEYLVKLITGVFLCDPAELNFDLAGGVQQTPLFESSSEWKLKASRDRGLKPLLRFFSKFFNDNIVSRMDDNFIFEFVGLDELTEQEKHELHKEQLASYKTLNEIRRAEDLPDVEHGDLVLNPTYIQAMQVTQQMEQAEQQMQQAAQADSAPSQEQGDADGDGTQDQDEGIPDYASQFVKSMVRAPQILEIQLDDYDTWLDVWRQ